MCGVFCFFFAHAHTVSLCRRRMQKEGKTRKTRFALIRPAPLAQNIRHTLHFPSAFPTYSTLLVPALENLFFPAASAPHLAIHERRYLTADEALLSFKLQISLSSSSSPPPSPSNCEKKEIPLHLRTEAGLFGFSFCGLSVPPSPPTAEVGVGGMGTAAYDFPSSCSL